MDNNDYKAKTIYSEPAQVQNPVTQQPPNTTAAPSKSSKKPLIIIVSMVLVIAVSVVAGVILTSQSSTKSPGPAKTQQDQSSGSGLLEPAKAIELEQTNNAINQDLSSLDDNKDFPTNSLDDKTLGL